MGLAAYAESRGIITVDTFNVTVARFKEFYPGKCACHFHKVTKSTLSSIHAV